MRSSLLALTMALGVATPVHAQDQDDTAQTSGGIQDIVVTAQKRSENLQDVPIAITAATGDTLAASGVRSSDDFAVAIPGINIKRQTGATLIYMRGVGTQGGAPGQEGAVATFVDGVYLTTPSGSTMALNNLERVEVLKGPQGTLYGRNATGGAINIITLTPSFDTKVRGSIGYGNKDTVENSLYLTSGLTKSIAADLAVYYRNQGEGFGTNTATGSDVVKGRDFAIRSKVLIEFSNDSKLVLSGDYSQYKGDEGVGQRAIATSSLVDGQQGYSGGYYDVNTNLDPYYTNENGGASATFTHDFGSTTLTSITAFRKFRARTLIDVDSTPISVLEADLTERTRQFSQELQVAGDAGALKWIVGAYYLRARTGYDPFNVFGGAIGAEPFVIQNSFMKTESIAAFAQATYALGDRTNLTVGGRLSSDKRSYHGELFSGTTPLAPADAFDSSKTFSRPTWRLSLDHKLTDDILGYVSYNRGFKSGVYGVSTPGEAPIDPEILDAYETGLKTTLFDRRLRFNTSLYYYKYKNIQLISQRGASQVLLNAAAAKIYGIDTDFEAVLTDNFSLKGGASYTHGRYRNFPAAPTATPNPLPPFGNIIVGAPANGNRMVFTPDWTANIAADLKVPTNAGEFAFNVSYVYNDGFYFTPDEAIRQNAYSLVNGQIMWTADNEHMNVRLWARNLLDKKYLNAAYSQTIGDTGVPAPGRTYGVSLGFDF